MSHAPWLSKEEVEALEAQEGNFLRRFSFSLLPKASTQSQAPSFSRKCHRVEAPTTTRKDEDFRAQKALKWERWVTGRG